MLAKGREKAGILAESVNKLQVAGVLNGDSKSVVSLGFSGALIVFSTHPGHSREIRPLLRLDLLTCPAPLLFFILFLFLDGP